MNTKNRRRYVERKIVEKLVSGVRLNRICKELQVGKRRAMMVRAKAEEAGYLDGRNELPPFPEALFPDVIDGRTLKVSDTWRKLEEHLPWIRERLESGWHAVTVYEQLPISVPRSSFYRFIIRHKLDGAGRALRRVVPEIVHAPGEALLVDWGFLWNIEQGGKKQKLWAFIGILGYSRYLVVRLMTVCDQTHTLCALSDMFDELSGVPRRITSDNPRVFAIEAGKYETLIHPVYERFASHYKTTIECLPPKSPEKKGKVERPVPYIRRLLEAYPGERGDVSALQRYLNQKLIIANERKHGTTRERPVDRFKAEEVLTLKPLPPLPYEPESYHETQVRLDGHVRFQNKYYSLSEEYIHKQVTIIGNSKQVSIYHNGKLIEVHERVTDRERSKSTKPQHLKPWEQICDNEDGLRGMAAKIGPAVENIVHAILKHGEGFSDFRKIWGILSLDKKYTHQEINTACELALDCDELSFLSVRRFIKELKESKVEEHSTHIHQPAKFQRDLGEYKQVLLNLTKPIGGIYEH